VRGLGAKVPGPTRRRAPTGAIVPCALLTAIGIGPDGKRSILGCSVKLSEAETHWRKFLDSLVARGMHGVKLVASDDHARLNAARQAVLAGVAWQRCQFHHMQNGMAHVPKIGMRAEIASDPRRVFDADEPAEAERQLRDAGRHALPERVIAPKARLRCPLRDQRCLGDLTCLPDHGSQMTHL